MQCVVYEQDITAVARLENVYFTFFFVKYLLKQAGENNLQHGNRHGLLREKEKGFIKENFE